MDPFEEQARTIKANPSKYRELDRHICECTHQRNTVAVLYVGEGGQRWLWTPGGRGPGNQPGEDAKDPITPVHHPPRAVPLPREPGDVAYSALAICPRCHTGLLLLPQADRIDAIPLGAPTWAQVTD